MEFTYIPNEYEIKLMILYTVKYLKIACNYTTIDYVISSCANVNYFELEGYITDLMNKGNLSDYDADNEKYYCVTEQGEETLGFFEGKIPGSIRLMLKDKISQMNRESSLGNKLSVDYFPINENEYTVQFLIEENNVVVMNLEFYAGPKERAIDICRYLKKNSSDFYKIMMQSIDSEVNKFLDRNNS